MFRMWLVALALFAALGGTASADVFDDNPAAVSLRPGNIELFARGPDGRILHRSLSGGAWGNWTPVDGLQAGSGPAAVVFGTSIYLFARGEADGALWQNVRQNGSWTGWVSLGGGITSAPAAALRRSNATIDVYVRGLDNAVFFRALVPGSGWGGWVALGGNFSAGPAAIGFHSSGSTDVFAPDATGLQWKIRHGDGTWNPAGLDWLSKGGGFRGATTAATPANDILNLYGRGLNDALYHGRHVNVGQTWTQVDKTPLASSPAAVSDVTGREYLFARIGGELYWREVSAAETATPSFGAWGSLGPVALPVAPQPPPPPTPPAPPALLDPRLSWTYKASRTSTRLGSLTLSRIPAGATVTVTCTKGCSAKRWTTKPKKSSLSLKRFTRRSIKVGRSIRVQVTVPGAIGSVKTLKMRRKKAPQLTSRCLPPGAKRAQRCAT